MTLVQLSILWYLAICISIVLFSYCKTGTSVIAFLVLGGVLIFTFSPHFKRIRRKLIKTVLFPCVFLIVGTAILIVSFAIVEKYPRLILSEIEPVEVYDTTLSNTGTLHGYVKNNSSRILKKLILDIVVFNSRGDVTFRGEICIECNVPTGQTRHFNDWNSIPCNCFSDKYTWSILNCVALG